MHAMRNVLRALPCSFFASAWSEQAFEAAATLLSPAAGVGAGDRAKLIPDPSTAKRATEAMQAAIFMALFPFESGGWYFSLRLRAWTIADFLSVRQPCFEFTAAGSPNGLAKKAIGYQF
jgi:hypothetical protein